MTEKKILPLGHEFESAGGMADITRCEVWVESGDPEGTDFGLICAQTREAHEASSGTKRIVLSGDTGGGRRELIVSVNGEQVGRMDYEQCGWSFRKHAEIFTRLGAALGVPVIDETR